jgi:hypothetical protein
MDFSRFRESLTKLREISREIVLQNLEQAKQSQASTLRIDAKLAEMRAMQTQLQREL